jgi:hypothetical protein
MHRLLAPLALLALAGMPATGQAQVTTSVGIF